MLQVQDQSLRPLTTAHLAQTMSLLALSNLELRERVLTEIASNPALEMLDDRVCPTCHRPLNGSAPCPVCSAPPAQDDLLVFLSPRESGRTSGAASLDETPADQEPAAPEDLALHVLAQIAGDLDPSERHLAAYVLSSLNDDGFLEDPPAIIARATRSSLSQVEHVLELIARADPPGLATAGPRQALVAQLESMDPGDPMVALARRMLDECFAELGRREFERIGQTLGVSQMRARQAAEWIHAKLNPYPARAFWGSGRQAAAPDPNVYHNPDIQISVSPNDRNALVVEIFSARKSVV